MNLGQMLAQTAMQSPDKTAIIFHDQRTSYRQFDERANQVANGLIRLGVEPGDRVALLIHNLPIFMEAYFGIVRTGASVVPLNVLYKAGEVEYILKDSGAKVMLTFAPFAPVALAAAANAPDLRHVIVAAPEAIPGAMLWRDAFGDTSASPPQVTVQDEDVAVICYTSGTTGHPKGAMLTHRNLLANCNQCSAIERVATHPDDVIWLALPLFH
ncbi:MAG TPA: AMP-binding protein, partial [Ktedonobacterales bacterium]|nr:AMP-binding protein [Ktedonobacterales bacterium]